VSNFDEIFERIKLATRTRTQIELANVLDIRQSSISDAKRRNSIPADWLMKLFERFGLNPDWIKRGIGPICLRTETGYAPVDMVPSLTPSKATSPCADITARNAIMSVYSMHPDVGTTQGGSEYTVVDELSVPVSLYGNGVKIFLLDNSGMEPLLRKGAFLGVDTTQKQVIAGELYAVDLPYEGIGIKRVFPDSAHAQALLRTENPHHPEIVLPFETLRTAILGRIIWSINKY